MKISVVIPVYNGAATIAKCLDSLFAQAMNTGDSLEIIVVDDASTDRTRTVLSRYPSLHVIHQTRNTGPAAARNAGALAATGDVILFTDADCEPIQSWVEEMTAPFREDSDVAGVKGVYRTRQSELTARYLQLEFEYKYRKLLRHKTIDLIDTYSAAYRRSTFIQAGGFDTSFPAACTEDMDLSFRLASNGRRLVFNPHAVVYHLHPTSWIEYARRKYRYAFWAAVIVRRFPEKTLRDSYTPVTQKLQLAIVPGSMLLSIGSLMFPVLYVPSMVGWVLALLTMVPFMRSSARKDWPVMMLTPVYVTLKSSVQCCALLVGMFRSLTHRASSYQVRTFS